MLGHFRLSRIAHKASPTREQRLLYFAGTPSAPGANPDETPEAENAAPKPSEAAGAVNAMAQDGKDQMAALLNSRQPDTDAVKGKKKKEANEDDEPQKTTLEMIEESKQKNLGFIKTLTSLEKKAKSKDVVDAASAQNETEDLNESLRWIMMDKEKTEQWDAIFDMLREWENGKMPAQEFVQSIILLLEKHHPESPHLAKLKLYAQEHGEEMGNYTPIEGINDIELTMKNWKAGSTTPQKFIAAVTKFTNAIPEADQTVVEKLRAYLENNADKKLATWEEDPASIDASVRQEVIAEMSEIANYDAMMAKIEQLQKTRNGVNEALDIKSFLAGSDAQIEQREGLFNNMEKGMNSMAAALVQGNLAANASQFKPPMGLGDLLNIKLFSPLQIWNAIKELKEAYLEGYNAWAGHGTSELASTFGDLFTWAPFADRMDTFLKKRLNSADEEQKNKYIEHLESVHPNFLDLCYKNDSFLKTEAYKDPNHARAILEYAAKKGFLYDLDDSAAKEEKIVLGCDLRELLHDYDDKRFMDYYHKLRSENASGRESSIKHGEERVHDLEKIPDFMHELDHEFHEGNIWECVGIAQRAIDRGLMSEVSPWILMTTLRHMRETPHVREFMPTMALDKMGSLAYYRAGGWTLGYLKGARNRGLMPWLRSNKDLDEAPDQGAAIYKIEQAVRHATKFNFDTEPNGKKYLDHLVAQVLATTTLQGEVTAYAGTKTTKITFDKKVSIFSDEFADYRNGNHLDMQGNTHPGIAKEDPDYYTAPCDNILSGAVPVSEILAPTGGGKFQHEVFAQDYIGNILQVYRGMRDGGLPKEATNFRKEMGRKLTSHFKVVLEDTRTSGIPDYKTRISNIEQPELAMRTLVVEGFIPIDIFVNTLWADVANTGTGMAKKIVRQVDSSLADRIESTKAQRVEDAKKDRSIIPSDPAAVAQILNEWKASKGKSIIDFPAPDDAKFIMVKPAPPKKLDKDDSPKD